MLVKHIPYILYSCLINGIVLAAVIGHEQLRRKGALVAQADRRTLSAGRVGKMDDICNDWPCQIDHAAGVSHPHLTIDHCTTDEARVALNTVVKIGYFTCIFSDNLIALPIFFPLLFVLHKRCHPISSVGALDLAAPTGG